MAKSKRKANSRRKSKSKPTSKPLTIAGLKRAIETRKAAALAGFYTHNAVVQIIDRDNSPSKPRNLEDKGAITSYFEDVCGRDMSHKITPISIAEMLFFDGQHSPSRVRIENWCLRKTRRATIKV